MKIKKLKASLPATLCTFLLQGCFGTSLPDNIEKFVYDGFSSKGKTSPSEVGKMGTYYFNTEILDASKMEVPNGLKVLFKEAYCVNLKTDEQRILYRNDEQKPLKPLTKSIIVYIKHSDDLMGNEGRKDCSNYGCKIQFIGN